MKRQVIPVPALASNQDYYDYDEFFYGNIYHIIGL